MLLLLLRLVSDAAMAPALAPLAGHRRHFPLFVAAVQLVAAMAYDACLTLGVSRLFIDGSAWHFVSDVLNLTYGLLVVLHLSAVEDEDLMVVLRYVAFFASWIVKYRDSWDSVAFEAALATFYVMGCGASHAANPRARGQFRMRHVKVAVGAAVVGGALFVAAQLADRASSHSASAFSSAARLSRTAPVPSPASLLSDVVSPLLMTGVHVSLGLACFEIWQVRPSHAQRWSKKVDASVAGPGGGGAFAPHVGGASASFV